MCDASFDVCGTAEAAVIAGETPRFLRRMATTGALTAHKVSGRLIWDREELRAWRDGRSMALAELGIIRTDDAACWVELPLSDEASWLNFQLRYLAVDDG